MGFRQAPNSYGGAPGGVPPTLDWTRIDTEPSFVFSATANIIRQGTITSIPRGFFLNASPGPYGSQYAAPITSWDLCDHTGLVVHFGGAIAEGADWPLPVGLELGWYRLFTYGADGKINGGGFFVYTRNNPNLPVVTKTNEPPSWRLLVEMLMMPERHSTLDAGLADTSAAIAAANANYSYLTANYRPYDTTRNKPIVMNFPSGFHDSTSFGGPTTAQKYAAVTTIVGGTTGAADIVWEGKNEPVGDGITLNSQGFPQEGGIATSAYVGSMQTTYNAIKTGNNQAKVAGPASVLHGAGADALGTFFSAGGGQWIDVFTTHSYNSSMGDLPLGRRSWDKLESVLAAAGPAVQNLPRMNTEAAGFFGAEFGAGVLMRQAEWTMLDILLHEQYKIQKESYHLFYSKSHGFNDYPSWYTGEDGQPHIAVAAMLTHSQELVGMAWESRLDFGTVDNDYIIGSSYRKADTTGVISMMTNGKSTHTQPLMVSGGSPATLTVVDWRGRESTVAVTAGKANVAIGVLPTYVRCPANVTLTPTETTRYGTARNTAVTFEVTGGSRGTCEIRQLRDLTPFVNRLYFNTSNTSDADSVWMSNNVPSVASPVSITASFARRHIDRIIVHAPPAWQSNLAPPVNADVEVQDENGTWSVVGTINEDPVLINTSPSVHPMTPPLQSWYESFWDEAHVWEFPFTRRLATGFRLVVRAATAGGAFNTTVLTGYGESTDGFAGMGSAGAGVSLHRIVAYDSLPPGEIDAALQVSNLSLSVDDVGAAYASMSATSTLGRTPVVTKKGAASLSGSSVFSSSAVRIPLSQGFSVRVRNPANGILMPAVVYARYTSSQPFSVPTVKVRTSPSGDWITPGFKPAYASLVSTSTLAPFATGGAKDAILVSTSVLSPTAQRGRAGAVALTSVSTLSSTGVIVTLNPFANLVASSSLSTSATLSRAGTSALVATSIISATGFVNPAASALIEVSWLRMQILVDVATVPTSVTVDRTGPNNALLSWQPPVDTNGLPVTGYYVERNAFSSTGIHSWSTTLLATDRSFDFGGLVADWVYDLKVYAITSAGNGTPAIVSAPSVITIDSVRAGITSFNWEWSSGWVTTSTSDRTASTAGPTGTVRYTGSSVTIYGQKGPAAGQMTVTVDGGAPIAVDCYSSTLQTRAALYTNTSLIQGAHVVVCAPLGTKVTESTGTEILLDDAVVQTLTPPMHAGYYRENFLGGSTGGWGIEENGTNLRNSTAIDADGALAVDAVTTGVNTRVRSSYPWYRYTPGVPISVVAGVSHTSATARPSRIEFIGFDANFVYTEYGTSTSATIATGAGTNYTRVLPVPTNPATVYLGFIIVIEGLNAGETLHLRGIRSFYTMGNQSLVQAVATLVSTSTLSAEGIATGSPSTQEGFATFVNTSTLSATAYNPTTITSVGTVSGLPNSGTNFGALAGNWPMLSSGSRLGAYIPPANYPAGVAATWVLENPNTLTATTATLVGMGDYISPIYIDYLPEIDRIAIVAVKINQRGAALLLLNPSTLTVTATQSLSGGLGFAALESAQQISGSGNFTAWDAANSRYSFWVADFGGGGGKTFSYTLTANTISVEAVRARGAGTTFYNLTQTVLAHGERDTYGGVNQLVQNGTTYDLGTNWPVQQKVGGTIVVGPYVYVLGHGIGAGGSGSPAPQGIHRLHLGTGAVTILDLTAHQPAGLTGALLEAFSGTYLPDQDLLIVTSAARLGAGTSHAAMWVIKQSSFTVQEVIGWQQPGGMSYAFTAGATYEPTSKRLLISTEYDNSSFTASQSTTRVFSVGV